MKRSLLFTAFISFVCSFSFSQEKNVYPSNLGAKTDLRSATQVESSKSESTEITSLKPADGNPATFGTKEELESAVPMKIASIKEAIKSGNYNDVQIQKFREEIWRFENAIVIKK